MAQGKPIRRLVQWLVPSHGAAPDVVFRAELVLGFGAFELLGTLMIAVSELAWGSRAIGAIYGVALGPMLAILVWARRGADPARAGTAFTAVLFVAISLVNFGSGGRAIGANIALPTVLLFAVLMSTPRAAAIWTLLALVEILALARLRISSDAFPIATDPQWVAHAIDRVPLLLSLISALIGVVTLRAMARFRARLEELRIAESTAREIAVKSATRFADFAAIAADGFWETDADLRLSYVSPGFARAMGLEAEQMIGLTPEQAYRLRFPEIGDLASYSSPMRREEQFSEQLLRTVDDSGAPHVLLNQGRPVYAFDDTFVGFRGAIRDITAQRNAEKALRDSEQRLRLVADNLPALIAYFDHEERYRFCNAEVGRFLGVDGASIIGRTLREVRGEATYASLAPSIAAALRGETASFEGTWRDAQGAEHFVQGTYVPDRAPDGAVRGFYAMAFDVTARREAEMRLEASERRLRLITDNMPALISYIDADRVFRFNNSTYEAWLRRPLAEITGRPVAEVYDAATFALVAPWIDRALRGEQVTFELDPSDVRTRHVRVTYVPEIDDDGHVLGIYGLIHDISELKRIEGELRTLAQFDSLTGLSNRSRLAEKLAEAIARSERSDQPMALMFLDLDRFKAINDELGHKAGDVVLQEFARRLSGCTRQTDTVARLAGDEFVVLLEGLHSADEARAVAEKIGLAMASPFDVLGTPCALSTSIGIAVRAGGELDGEALLRRADEALYRVKTAGRGAYAIAP